MKKQKSRSLLREWTAIVLLVYFALFPKAAFQPTSDALLFSATRLVPSLFVFLVLSKAVLSKRPVLWLAKKMGMAPFLFVLGTVCGFPTGAVCARKLFDDRAVNKKTAEYLMAVSNNASLSFVTGFLGTSVFENQKTGVVLLCLQWAACLLSALLLKRIMFGALPLPSAVLSDQKSVSLADAAREGGLTMLTVCSCVVFFSVLGGVAAAPFCGTVWETVIKGIFEFSTGCSTAARDRATTLPLCGFFVGFSGLSVAAQVKSCGGRSLSAKPYFALKCLQGALLFVFASVWELAN